MGAVMLFSEFGEGRMDLHGFPVRLIGQSDAPAWVQAIGSVLAIVFAVLIQRKTNLEAQSDRLGALQGVMEFAQTASAEAMKIWEGVASGELEVGVDQDRISHARGLVGTVPAFQFGRVDIVSLIYDVDTSLKKWLDLPEPLASLKDGFFADQLVEARETDGKIGSACKKITSAATAARRRTMLWWIPFP